MDSGLYGAAWSLLEDGVMPTSTGYQVRAGMIQDHERIEQLLEKVLAAFEANDQDEVAASWTEFDRALLAHLHAEERFLIPALFRVNQRAARTLLEEHRHIRTRLTELGAGVDLHIVRLGAARSFIDDLRAHARHEDALLYQWADEHVDDADRGLLLRALAKATELRARLSRIPTDRQVGS